MAGGSAAAAATRWQSQCESSRVLQWCADENRAGTCTAQCGCTRFCGGHQVYVPACSRSPLAWGPGAVEFSDDRSSSQLDQLSHAAACHAHKGDTGFKALVLKKKIIYWMGMPRINNWESSCFDWSYVFAARCFQPTRWEKWACLPFVYCSNPHVPVHIVQREKKDTYLYVSAAKWRTGYAQWLTKLKGCAEGLRAVESLPRLGRSCWRLPC